MNKEFNRRYVLWAQVFGYDPNVIIRGDNEVIRINGLPWTILFIEWIQKRWRVWAGTLGYTGNAPHLDALIDGHSFKDFDRWLEDNAEREQWREEIGDYS